MASASATTDAPDGFVAIKEGQASILFPSSDEVFYNPVQEFNRDLSIHVIKTFCNKFIPDPNDVFGKRHARRTLIRTGHLPEDAPSPQERIMVDPQTAEFDRDRHGVSVLEALAASGLRSIRYYKEIPAVRTILCNDLMPEALESIARNVSHNGLDASKHVIPNQGDCNAVMHQAAFGSKSKDRFDIIDLDPYGTASPFLDAAVQAVTEGGLLCVTCTDMAVLAGSSADACFAKYGSMALRGSFCHEMGVRIVLNSLSTAANRYGRVIEPLLSCSIDFYTRMFVRVKRGPAKAKKCVATNGLVYCCSGCNSFVTIPFGTHLETKKGDKFRHSHPPAEGRCPHCSRSYQIGGPTWLGPMHDKEFVAALQKGLETEGHKYKTRPRMDGMLAVCQEELDLPFHYATDAMAGTLHCASIPHTEFRSALGNGGYAISNTHTNPQGFKTDAPPAFVWDIMRAWVKKNPVSEKTLAAKSPGSAILSQDMTHEIDFTFNKAAQAKAKSQGLVRYQANPTENWGPKSRAKRKQAEVTDESKKSKPEEA